MRYFFQSALIFLFLATMASCTEVGVEIPAFEEPDSKRVVLLEDLTGVQCPNCPKGAAALEDILGKFPNNVVAVGVHGNFLTKPLPESKYDFRNPKSIALEEYLKPFLGKPSAHINRTYFEGELYTAVDAPELWQSYVEKELKAPHVMDLVIEKSYNASTRQLSLTVKATPLINETGNYKMSIYLTESDIVDPQENQGTIIEDYKHNHVLRDMLTTATGDELATVLEKGKIVSKSFIYTIPEAFKVANMEVVAMVARANGSDKSVMQAAGTKVTN
ncbi:MAG: Omp28-related outer membrane protein [Saprospiraceae bacterium]|nr:Omp28-related outer membrane protein [Saprospiraceae bacterium]